MSGAFRTANATVAAHGAASVTLSDSATIPNTRSLYIGVSGDVKVTMADGQTVTFKNTNSGVDLPVQRKKKKKNGTTATDIIALY